MDENVKRLHRPESRLIPNRISSAEYHGHKLHMDQNEKYAAVRGVLQISSDGDDRMGAKLKTHK